MTALPATRRYTPAEYLALERAAPYKSEYLDGGIYAMAGTSWEHDLIATSVVSNLYAQMRGRPCWVQSSDIRVKVSPSGMYTYPDVSALCGEPRFEDAQTDTLLNLQVIVEVLSPSTEAYDRGKKFAHYQRLASLQDYVLIAQDEMRVEQFTRQGNLWMLSVLTDPAAMLQLASIGCAVPVRDIYERIAFPTADATPLDP